MPNLSYEYKFTNKGKLVAGVDEAGRGSLAGPVVAAAVILPPEIEFLNLLNDSKKLSKNQRENLYQIISSSSAIFSFSVINNYVIDEINILQASLLAMKDSVDSLELQPDHLLIDGNRYQESVLSYTTIIKGDSISASIAAASVVAKVTRDNIMADMDTLYPEYGFRQHKGYATKLHFEKLDKYGLSPIHRKTFLKKYFSRQIKIF